jgi:hypothetical protein
VSSENTGLTNLNEGEWRAPLPRFEQPAIRQRFRIGTREFRIQVSEIKRDVAYEPDTDLIHLSVEYGQQPLTPIDLGLIGVDAAANAWAYMTNRLNETVVQFYAPQPRPQNELNPRLGCWGPRPDLVERGLGDHDGAIAAVMGLSIWRPGSNPPVSEQVFLEALRDTLLESVSYWVVLAQKTAGPVDRLN